MASHSPLLLTTNDILENNVATIRSALSTSPRHGGVIQVPNSAGDKTHCALSGILDLSYPGASDSQWVPLHNYSLGDFVHSFPHNGFRYEVTTDAGISGGSQPTWPTTAGSTVTDGGITWTCRASLPLLVDVVGLNILANDPGGVSGAEIDIAEDQYIRVIGSVVRFRGITFRSEGALAAVVICRGQYDDAPEINYCGFEDCTFLGTWTIAPVVAYGAELIQFRNCTMANKSTVDDTAALSLDSADLTSFKDGSIDDNDLSADFDGHSSSGVHILNCSLVNIADGLGRTGLRLGDAVSHAYIKGTWIAVPSGDSNIEFNGYTAGFSRLRYPRQITMDSATTFTDSSPAPAVPFRFNGTALPTEFSINAAPF